MSSIIKKREDTALQIFNIDELYRGVSVPNKILYEGAVGDFVIDPTQGVYQITGFNGEVPILELWINPSYLELSRNKDLDAGLSRNHLSEGYYAFYDDSVAKPIVIADPWTYIFGSEFTEAKVFLGEDTTQSGKVISRRYDSAGNMVSESIPLVRAGSDLEEIMIIPPFNVDTPLNVGEIITIVPYNSRGSGSGKMKLKVAHSSAIKSNTISSRYVVDIKLVSDLISKSDPSLILNDVNVPLQTSLFDYQLVYSDGTLSPVSGIDGNRVKLMGLQDHDSSRLGRGTSVTVVYYPTDNEAILNSSGAANPNVNATYRLANRKGVADFGLKLYVVPVYQGVADGYKLNFYLFDDKYEVLKDVTESVTLTRRNDNGPFEPAKYGDKQELQLVMKLEDVIPGLSPDHIHVQRFDITLDTPSSADDSNAWIIDYITDGSLSLGYGVKADVSNTSRTVNLRNSKLNLVRWLDDLYQASAPIFDEDLSSGAPTPTHFKLEYQGEESTHEINKWDDDLPLTGSDVVNAFGTVKVTWIWRDGSKDKYLGVTPLLIRLLD